MKDIQTILEDNQKVAENLNKEVMKNVEEGIKLFEKQQKEVEKYSMKQMELLQEGFQTIFTAQKSWVELTQKQMKTFGNLSMDHWNKVSREAQEVAREVGEEVQKVVSAAKAA